MPTRTEAAEALYEASVEVQKARSNLHQMGRSLDALLGAARAYSTSTPDPLPAEVQRVLEAADKYERTFGRLYDDDILAEEACPLVDAIRAYRSNPDPEPLSARLARLRPGSVVRAEHGEYRIVANDPDVEMLWVRLPDANGNGGFFYENITAILSESP